MFKKPNTVPTPDEFFDIALRDLSGAQFKCLAAIIKKTLGFNKIWDYISTSQLMEITGLSNRSVIDSTELLEQKTFIQSVYVCGHCGGIIESINRGQGGRGKCLEKPSSECVYCTSKEMPQKWYALSFEGEEINEYLDNIRGPRQRRIPGWGNEKSSQDRKTGSEKISQPCEQSSLPCEKTSQDSEKISHTININQTISQTDNQTKDSFVTEKSSDDNKKIKFASYREQLQSNKNALTAFEYIADKSNFRGIKGNVLKQFCEWSPKIVEEAFIETHKRNIDSFEYFAQVFKTKYDNSLRKSQPEDANAWVLRYKEYYGNAVRTNTPFINTPFDIVKQWFAADAARLSITVEECVMKITQALKKEEE